MEKGYTRKIAVISVNWYFSEIFTFQKQKCLFCFFFSWKYVSVKEINTIPWETIFCEFMTNLNKLLMCSVIYPFTFFHFPSKKKKFRFTLSTQCHIESWKM